MLSNQTITVESLVEELQEDIKAELRANGLSLWSLEASGFDFKEKLGECYLEDLKKLRESILEGLELEVTIDLSLPILEILEKEFKEVDKEQSLAELDKIEEENKEEILALPPSEEELENGEDKETIH